MLRTWSWPTWRVSSWAAKSKSALTLLLFSFFFLGDSKSRFWKFISSTLVWPVPLAQVLPRHQDLSKNTKGTFQFLRNFQLLFNLIFSEEIIQYSRTFALQVQKSWNRAHAPLLIIKSFPETPTESEASHLSGSHNCKTKQTTFLDR
jgi:hypothetical protein